MTTTILKQMTVTGLIVFSLAACQKKDDSNNNNESAKKPTVTDVKQEEKVPEKTTVEAKVEAEAQLEANGYKFAEAPAPGEYELYDVIPAEWDLAYYKQFLKDVRAGVIAKPTLEQQLEALKAYIASAQAYVDNDLKDLKVDENSENESVEEIAKLYEKPVVLGRIALAAKRAEKIEKKIAAKKAKEEAPAPAEPTPSEPTPEDGGGEGEPQVDDKE